MPDDLRQYQLLRVPEIGELQDQIDSELTRHFLFQVCAPCPHRHFEDLVMKRKVFEGPQIFDSSGCHTFPAV